MKMLVQAVMIYIACSKMREARPACVVIGDFEGGIDLEDAPKYGQLLTRQDVHELCARVRDLVRQRDELQEEVVHLQETLGMFAALRDLMYDDSPALAHVGQNGHVALPVADDAPHGDPAGDVSIVEAFNPHDDPANNRSVERFPGDDDALDEDAGDGPSVEATNPDDNLAADDDPDALQAEEDAGDISLIEAISDSASAAIPRADDPRDDHVQADTVETGEDASAILAPTPPGSLLPAEHDAIELPSAETEPGETAPSPTPRPVPDGPIDPVEASGTAVPRPPVEAGGKVPLPGTLKARILDLIAQSARPKRPWQVQKELGLPRLPCAELSKLVSEGHLVRVKDACYGLPNRDYNGVVSAEGDES